MAQASLSPATMRKGAAIATVSALSFGSAGVFVRYAYQAGILPGTAVFLRFAISALVLGVVLAFRSRLFILPPRQLARIFLLGLIGYTILGATFYMALGLLPTWLVFLFISLHPLTINVGSWIFLGERPSPGQVLALTLVLFGGIFLFLQPFEGVNWLGILLMVVNVLIMVVYILVGQQWTQAVPPVISATWIIIGGTVGAFIYALSIDEFSFSFASIGWFWALCFALISTALAFIARWWGIGLIGASRTMIIGSFEPLWGVMLAVLVLGEKLSMLQALGGVFILSGMFLAQWQPNMTEKQPDPTSP